MQKTAFQVVFCFFIDLWGNIIVSAILLGDFMLGTKPVESSLPSTMTTLFSISSCMMFNTFAAYFKGYTNILPLYWSLL